MSASQLFHCAVRDDAVAQIQEPGRAQSELLFRAGVQDAAADAARGADFLRGQQFSRLFQRGEALLIRIGEHHAELDDLRRNSLQSEPVGCVQRLIDHGSVTDDREILPLAQNRLRMYVTVLIPSLAAARVAHGDRPRKRERKAKHLPQFRKARGTQNRHAGNRAEITDIEQPLVRLPVAAHKTGPVHAENNVKPHQGGVMDQHIKAALQKARIHGKDRHKALLGHAGRHGDGVALGNAHVKKPVRVFRRKAFCPGTAGHGRCDGDDTPVLFGKFAQVFS